MITLGRIAVSLVAVLAILTPAWGGNIVANPDFAAPVIGTGYTPIADWTSSAPSGQGTGSNTGPPFWDNGTVPDGITNVGFIHVNPDEGHGALPTDSLSQALVLDPGTIYSYSFFENARGASFSGDPLVEVLLGGSTLVAQSVVDPVGSGNPFVTVSGTFTASSSSEVLEFLVTQQTPNDDSTFLVTGVDVEATPEPGTAALMSLALVGGFLALTTRRCLRTKA